MLDSNFTIKCFTCKLFKPLTNFYYYKNQNSYHKSCNTCSSKAEKARYQNDPEYRARKIAYVKNKYRNDPEYRTKHLSYQKNRKLKNRLEFRAKELLRGENPSEGKRV